MTCAMPLSPLYLSDGAMQAGIQRIHGVVIKPNKIPKFSHSTSSWTHYLLPGHPPHDLLNILKGTWPCALPCTAVILKHGAQTLICAKA